MSEETEFIIDFRRPATVRLLHGVLSQLGAKASADSSKHQHEYRVTIVRHRARRSDRQNRWYWPCFVKPFGDYLRDQGNSHFTDLMAHEVLKKMFLERTVIDRKTGQAFTFVESTTELSTVEFNEYLDKVAEFLAREFDFIVPEPSVYREAEDRRVA